MLAEHRSGYPTDTGLADWYNHRRLHGSLGWLTPVEDEQDDYLPSAESRTRIGQAEMTLHECGVPARSPLADLGFYFDLALPGQAAS